MIVVSLGFILFSQKVFCCLCFIIAINKLASFCEYGVDGLESRVIPLYSSSSWLELVFIVSSLSSSLIFLGWVSSRDAFCTVKEDDLFF